MAGGIVVLQAQQPSHTTPKTPVQSAAKPAGGTLIDGYRSWKKVNTKPHIVTSRIAMMCRAPTKEEIEAEATDPHLEELGKQPGGLRARYVTVYANPPAEQAMLHQKHPVYPVGSLIVKERLPHPDSKTPELITVMHKREKGYNPGHGDWEFLTLDSAAKQITAQGRLQKCEACHAEWKKTDYTSRAYLSEAVTRQFR